jgi:hypothetical protein
MIGRTRFRDREDATVATERWHLSLVVGKGLLFNLGMNIGHRRIG